MAAITAGVLLILSCVIQQLGAHFTVDDPIQGSEGDRYEIQEEKGSPEAEKESSGEFAPCKGCYLIA